MSQTTKAFSGVKLKVNFTAIPSSTAMSNIASDDNISDTFAKIHHWYVKTNGFQASASPLVSTSSSGIVNALPSATGGFLKNTGTTGGTWTTISSSDLPSGIVYNTGNVQLNGLFEPSGAGDGSQITTSNGNTNMAQLGRENYPFSNIYGVNIHAVTKSDTVKPSLNISWYDASGNNNGDWKFEIEDNTNGLTLSENGNELFNFDADGTFACESLSVTTINGKVVGNNPKFTDTVTTVTSDNSVGNAITNVTASNGQLTLSRGTFLTSHPTITTSTDTNNGQQAQVSQSYEPYFTAIDSITCDENGHVKKVNTATISLPRERLSSLSGAYGSNNKTWVTTLTSDRFGAQNPATYTSTVPTASTSAYGITKLSNTYTSADASVAATQTAVNNVYKLANNFITNYCNNHLVEISYFPSYKRYDKSGSTPVVREVFRFNAVSSTSGVTITECGCVFYRSTTATSDEPDTQTLSCELLKTDANSSTGVTLATSNFTNKTMYSPSIAYNSDTISIFVRPWFDYTYNGTTYTAYGDIIRANIGAGFLMDSTDGCWRNINESGYPKFITEDDLGSAAYTASTAYAAASHTHDTLVSKTLTAETIDSTAGNFFFKGNNLLGNVNDWVGMQGDAGNDKFQLIVNGNNFLIRQNDTGGTNSTNWTNWVGNMRPDNVTGSNGITVETVTTTIGSGNDSLIYDSGVNVKHSNSVTAETTFDKSRFKYDAQGHVTSSSYWVHKAVGTGGVAGWIKIATMVHTKTYDSTPIMLTIAQRGTIPTYRLHIRFKNANSTDPDIDSFFLAGDAFNLTKKPSAYIIKSATSTWDVYIKKLDNYENLVITEFDVGGYFADHMTWTWKDEQVAESAITGGTEATLYDYSRIDHTHSEYIPLTGSEDITGNLEITKATGSTGYYANRSDTGTRVYFGVGSGGTAHGIYSYALGGWAFKHDGGTTTIPMPSGGSINIGGITVPSSSGSFLATGNTSFSSSLTSGTKIGTITIGGTATDLYCQTNTDTKVTNTVGTANTYYPTGLTATATTTGTQVFDTSLKFIGTTGSTSAVGKAQLVLGNATASGTANNKQGSIVVYGSTAYAHTIQGAPTAARTLTLPNATGTLALTSDLSSYIPLSGSSVIDGDLTPHASNTYSLGSSSYKWNEMYVAYANIGSLYQANGTAGGSITSYSSIVPNSTNYDLGSTSKKWGTVYTSTIGDGTTTYAVSNLLTTVGNTKIGGPLTPANNLDGNCKLGDDTHRWYYSYTTYMNTTNAVVSTSISGDAIFKDISSSINAKTGDAGKTFTADHYIHAYLILNKFVYIRLRVIPGTGGITTNTSVYLASIPTSYMCSNVISDGLGSLIGLGRRLDTYKPIHCWINNSRQIRCRLDTDLAATKALEVEFFYELS